VEVNLRLERAAVTGRGAAPGALSGAGGATASLPGSPKRGLRVLCYRGAHPLRNADSVCPGGSIGRGVMRAEICDPFGPRVGGGVRQCGRERWLGMRRDVRVRPPW
jgi:hypothetical protein